MTRKFDPNKASRHEIEIHTAIVFAINEMQGHCPQALADKIYFDYIATAQAFDTEALIAAVENKLSH